MTASKPDEKTLSGEEVNLAYQLFLGREASVLEIERMQEKGTEISRLRRVFLSSPEFANRLKQLLINHDVLIQRRLQPHKASRYVHLHIPKTAGTTMSAILAASVGRGKSISFSENAKGPLAGKSPADLVDYRFIHGHLSYKVMSYLPPDSQAICVLRRPGDRLLSFYKYVSRTDHHPLYRPLTKWNMSFGDFLEFIDGRPQLKRESDNVQMRILSGLTEVGYLGQEQKVFELAMSNLLNDRILFGLTERFDAFQAWLKHKGLLKTISTARLNASNEPAKLDQALEELTADQRAIFDSYVVWDNLLYEVCDKIAADREAALADADAETQIGKNS